MRRLPTLAAAIGLLAATPAGQEPVPRIPLCAGMTLVTAVNDASGDYESIKTLESLDDEVVRIKYSAQKMDYGDMFSTDPPKVRQYLSRRVVRREDMRTSRAYLQEFSPEIPEAVPGMTALGTSTLVLEELKKNGEAEFGISHWSFPVPPTLDPDDAQGIYHKQMKVKSTVLERRVMLPVIVNGVSVQLPAVHTKGNFYSYDSEFWFLDQADNPLTLRFLIGIGDLKPLTAQEREKCREDTKLLGFVPQNCARPEGGAGRTLDLVKINYRCAATTLPEGKESGAGAAAGGAAAGSGNAATLAPGSGGALGALDAGKLEESLQKEGRVEIPDIYFTFGSDEIREESTARLNDVAQVLKRHPDWKLKVEGHTDSIAADDYNLKLSQRRADAVKNALVTRFGIDTVRLTTEGFGETRPRASNDNVAGRARNRRVELVRVQ